jgi:hypothetical protein
VGKYIAQPEHAKNKQNHTKAKQLILIQEFGIAFIMQPNAANLNPPRRKIKAINFSWPAPQNP